MDLGGDAEKSISGMKSHGVALGHSIVRIHHKCQTFVTHGRIVNLIPMGTMHQQTAGNRSGGGLVYFIHSNQKPLMPEPFPYRVNLFRFHMHLAPTMLQVYQNPSEVSMIRKKATTKAEKAKKVGKAIARKTTTAATDSGK